MLTWLPGRTADPHQQASNTNLARDLTALIQKLRRDPTGGRVFHGDGRGGDLTDHDDWIAHCIRQSDGLVDTHAMAAMWTLLRTLPRRSPDVKSHTDLIPGNLLVRAGRLAAVLDTGGYQPADPALDLVCARHLFDSPTRAVLRSALDSGDLEWDRGRRGPFSKPLA